MVYGNFLKRAFLLIMVASIMSIPFLALASENTIQISVNGQVIETKNPPMIINDRTMVTCDTITYIFGVVPALYPDKAIEFRRDYNTLILNFGGNASINGEETKVDSPAQIIDGKQYVPLRFIAENFGSTVEWDSVSNTVKITTDTNISIEKTFIENSSTNIYSSEHMGIKTIISQGSTIIAAPYSDNLLAYLPSNDPQRSFGILQIMAFPQAAKTFGNRKGEDVMMDYFKTEAAKKSDFGLYEPGGIEILQEKEIDFLGEKALEITYKNKPFPGNSPLSSFENESFTPLKFITVGLTKNDTLYQIRLWSPEEAFDKFLPAYSEAVENLIVISPPKIISSEINPQVVDVSPIYDLNIDFIGTIKPIVESERFIKNKYSMGYQYKVGDELIDVNIHRYDSVEKARQGFSDEMEYVQFFYRNELFPFLGWKENEANLSEKFTHGGNGDNRYCYSIIKQERGSPESYLLRMNLYRSSVVIQKNNLVLQMTEESKEPLSHKDEVIKYIADLIASSK